VAVLVLSRIYRDTWQITLDFVSASVCLSGEALSETFNRSWKSMMMIASITFKSSLVPLLEGL